MRSATRNTRYIFRAHRHFFACPMSALIGFTGLAFVMALCVPATAIADEAKDAQAAKPDIVMQDITPTKVEPPGAAPEPVSKPAPEAKAKPQPKPEQDEAAPLPAPEAPSASECAGYNILTAPRLTRNWGGVRSQLEDVGVKVSLYYNQFLGTILQGPETNGGTRCSGSWDLLLDLDLEKMGLIPGGRLFIHPKGHWKRNVNPKV
ncbi:MAG: hypothetical protein JXO22_11625, partial [Phycisphaerae bacterium]|nr:hypothetical protein [Phycisphaerae bacterium]